LFIHSVVIILDISVSSSAEATLYFRIKFLILLLFSDEVELSESSLKLITAPARGFVSHGLFEKQTSYTICPTGQHTDYKSARTEEWEKVYHTNPELLKPYFHKKLSPKILKVSS
jgi:hypothetical protein